MKHKMRSTVDNAKNQHCGIEKRVRRKWQLKNYFL